jgi:DNA-binding MarR family transcriptional regulator
MGAIGGAGEGRRGDPAGEIRATCATVFAAFLGLFGAQSLHRVDSGGAECGRACGRNSHADYGRNRDCDGGGIERVQLVEQTLEDAGGTEGHGDADRKSDGQQRDRFDWPPDQAGLRNCCLYLLNRHYMHIHLLDMERLIAPTLPCLCANVRRAARVLTQHYDDALRPLGLTITQFTILQALALAGDVTQGRLGEILAMDSTTLTRTLSLMNRQGWIAKGYGADRRERRLRLTRAGKFEFNRAVPHWQELQETLRSRLGKERWNDLAKLMSETTSLIAETGGFDGTTI